MVNVNDFSGATDSDQIEAAFRAAKDGVVILPRRCSEKEPERDWWLLDRAILLPGNTTLVLQNCRVKRSDRCRDNFVRSANVGIGIEHPEHLSHLAIIGEGYSCFEGADHPRATGDSSKKLACPCPIMFNDPDATPFINRHGHSFGTDAGKEGEEQTGDWRNIGILIANVDHLTISHIRIIESHGWGISMEQCRDVQIDHIDFQACMTRVIDGEKQNIENQDGINLRNDCHNVVLDTITGTTGDDVIAITVCWDHDRERKCGELHTSHVIGNDYTGRDAGASNVIIRNVVGYPAGGCCMIRLLATGGATIRNVVIDGVIDSSPDDFHCANGVLIGGDLGYGAVGTNVMSNISISNVIGNSRNGAAMVGIDLHHSSLSNLISRNPDANALVVDPKYFPLRDTAMSNIGSIGQGKAY